MKYILFLVVTLLAFCNSIEAQQEFPLYTNGDVYESNGITKEEEKDQNDFVTNVTYARMYAYLVPEDKSSGAAVLICPGGGYAGLSVEKEGVEMAKWLNDLGISAFVLYYRMPNGNSGVLLDDAERAMRIIRKNAKEWNIDSNKIGVAGFSAGGHLAATLGTHFPLPARPNFMILAYPVISMTEITHSSSKENLLGKDPSDETIQFFSNELQVKNYTPTAFLVHASDDLVVSVENSQMFYDALQAKNIPAEIHIFEKGGHGFGLRKQNLEVDTWPNLLKNWLEANKWTKQ